jgi:ribonuclease HI
MLRFDGVSIPNPGESASAAVIYDPANNVIASKSQYIKYANNNQAEYGGLILGLELAASLCIKNLMIEGDSEYVIYQVTGKYRVKDVYLDNIVKNLLQTFDYVGIRHISAADNFDADKLSRASL